MSTINFLVYTFTGNTHEQPYFHVEYTRKDRKIAIENVPNYLTTARAVGAFERKGG